MEMILGNTVESDLKKGRDESSKATASTYKWEIHQYIDIIGLFNFLTFGNSNRTLNMKKFNSM